jgi:glycosyltransferase involved in cell wall biosynthesis
MKHILYIGNRLVSSGKTATTIDTLGPMLEQDGYELRYASTLSHIGKRMFDMMSTTYKNRKWADLVLIDTYSTRNFWYAIIIARICGFLKLKYVPILHGGNLPRRLESHPAVFRDFLNRAWKVVSPSIFLEHAFAKAGFSNIHRINNFIEIDNYPFKKRNSLAPKLLWVRSFASIYNPQMAIDVLSQVKKDRPDASLTMVGPEKDGSMAACKERAQDLAVDVRFTGLLSKKQWIELSKEHDIFINTTHFDNLPVSLIEAMALGLPIVSTNVGGIPYLIQDAENGWLVEDGDVEQMAFQIIELVNHSSMTEAVVEKARHTAEQHSWEFVGKSWQRLLQL